ncbi:cupin domain-containing protein [Nostoc sp. 106C]|uniref:cupin domain-containing protein n=1 Tax=Nostoc sp. 106C TaxID=1932667 RepID=UPI000A37687A|nr:cupin domain-containing protein [Nostoc sp. 106C]OUL26938.1 cupin [Nostoc sp. 106C]
MSSTIITNQSFVTQMREQIEYPQSGVLSKVLLKNQVCQYTLFCLAANTEISEHTSTRNAIVKVIQGRGLLILSGKNIVLEPGVLVFMPANTPHALQSDENLTFLLTLSEKVANIN